MTDFTQLLAELAALQDRVELNKAHRYTFDRAWRPGTTTVIKTLNAPGLNRWAVRVQVEGTARAAYANPPQPGEALEQYVGRMKVLGEKALEHERLSDAAKIIGIDVHKLIEHELRTDLGLPSATPKVCEDALFRFAGFRQWSKFVALKPLAVEARVVNVSAGYCGTIDALVIAGGKLVLLDWKPKPDLWDERRLQSAAYRKALVSLGWPEMEGAIVPVPESGDIRMVYAESPGPDLEQAYDAFLALLRVYRWQSDVGKRERAARRA